MNEPLQPTSGGPHILFFSGGTALSPIASALTRHTVNAVHVITTFDSGGSSAELRRVFNMPAVGDVRARIIALAAPGQHVKTLALFGYRLPTDHTEVQLHQTLRELASGEHPLSKAIPSPERETILHYLNLFCEELPPAMNLAGASIGNVILTAGYLSHARQIEPVAGIFSKLVQAQGQVRPVSNECAHLCVELEDGTTILGQHQFTGKTASPIHSPIRRLWLSATLTDATPISVAIRPRLAETIRSANLICYPVGSFFSSVMANLLPEGVAPAIRHAACPKVFLPNLGSDPELFGLSIQDQILFLLRQTQCESTPTQALTHLLVDEESTRYAGGIPEDWLRERGITLRRSALVASPPYLDPDRVCQELMLLAR